MKGLYAIVDAEITPREQLPLLTQQVIDGGASVVQYRDKLSNPDQRLETAKQLLAICRAAAVPFILNDHPEQCLAVGADGVHLGKDDPDVESARQLLGDKAIIGASCYDSVEEALWAQGDGASYVAFGAMFPSSTKPNAPVASISTLYRAQLHIQCPVVAIGGITPDNGDEIVEAGADMIAVISGLAQSSNPTAAAQRYLQLFQTQQ